MSRRSKKRKVRDPRRRVLAMQHWQKYHQWVMREPSLWRIFAWLKWRNERPNIPKWVKEYDDLCWQYSFFY